MNQSSQKVISYLTGNENLESVTVDDLRRLVAESPFFAVNQFLLAKKLKEENEKDYSSQVEKAALYFSNQHWLQAQLEDDFFEGFDELQPINIETKDETNAAIVTSSTPAITLKDDFAQEKAVLNPKAQNDEEPEKVASPDLSNFNYNKETAEENFTQADEEMAAVTRDTNKETDKFINQLPAAEIPVEHALEKPSEEVPVLAEPEVAELDEEMAGVRHDTDISTKLFLEELQSQPQESEEPPLDDEHDKMFQNIKAMLDATSEEADADTKNSVITIDPYYTIDYFASQGIKLELDQNPNDQLGQHLKKFTHWLKHMKKLGPEDATELISRTETEADIQQIADSSNTIREVVTEAMASVLEKQGKKDKAIELYNKLSFLNPHKNAYFADKIKKLKGF